jgi:L,D-transpeptidase ErfK/SrfK
MISTRVIRVSWAVLSGLLATSAVAERPTDYLLPENGDNVIGSVTTAFARHEDTLHDIGRRYGVGYQEMLAANPGVDSWMPGEGTEVLIPSRYILPDAPREGIVVNLPEQRLYYFPPARKGERRIVRTYPISTGKMDWKTPLGETRIVSKQENPNWYPPASVLKEHEERGDPLPKVVPAGPANPLGAHAMRLGIPGGAYLIHGTNRPAGVGMQVTHGCIRMYPENIAELYELVPVKTKVRLIDQTTKVGWYRGTLFVERHAPMEGTDDPSHEDIGELTRLVNLAADGRDVDIDWANAERAFVQATGVPVPLSVPRRSALNNVQ